VRDRTSQVGETVANAASKAKTPLIAGGAALAGLAGGAVLARNGATKGSLGRSRGRGPNLSMPNLPKPSLPKVGTDSASVAKALGTAAKEVGKAGFKAGELATEVRRVREQMKDGS
jgi:hypothetical protein